MAAFSTIATAAGLAISAAGTTASIVQGSKAGKGGGGAPPTPASYYSYEYDHNGNLVQGASQVWDPVRNAYITMPRQLSAEERQEMALRTQIRTKMLNNLNATPDDRKAAYEEIKNTFVASMRKGTDREFAKLQRSTEESMEARGMTGSRADVDTRAELAQSKLESDADVEQKGVLMARAAEQQDQQTWLNTLNALDSGARADAAQRMAELGIAQNSINSASAALLGAYNAQSQDQLARWKIKSDQNQKLLGTASGLAYMYYYLGNKRDQSMLPGASGKSTLAFDIYNA